MNISRSCVAVFSLAVTVSHVPPTRMLLNFKDSSDRKQLEHEMNF